MGYEELYKARPIPKLANSLAKRCHAATANRQEKQRELFWAKRNPVETLPLHKSEPPAKKKKSRAEMLITWKAEKLKKLEEEKKNKKPVFKVGVVQRTATGSPMVKKDQNNKKNLLASRIAKKNLEEKQGVVTRSRAKAITNHIQTQPTSSSRKNDKKPPPGNIKLHNQFCKIDVGVVNALNSYKFNPPKSVTGLTSANKLTYPQSPKITQKKKNSEAKMPNGVTKHLTKSERKLTFEESPSVTSQKPRRNKSKSQQVSDFETPQPDLSKNILSIDKRESQESPKPLELSDENLQKTTPRESLVTCEIPDTRLTPRGNEKNQQNNYKTSSPQGDNDGYKPIYYSPFVTIRSGRKSGRKSKLNLSQNIEEEIKREENEFHCRIYSFRKYVECETRRLLDLCDVWKNIAENFKEIPPDVEGDINSVVGKTKLLTSDKFVQFKGLIDKCEKKDPFIKLDDLQGFQDWISIEVEKVDSDFAKIETIKNNNWVMEPKTSHDAKPQKLKPNVRLPAKPVGKSNIRSHIQALRKKMKENITTDDSVKLVPQVTPCKKETTLLQYVLESGGRKKSLSEVTPSRRNSGLEILIASQKSKFSSSKKALSLLDENMILTNQENTNRSILRKTPHTIKEKAKNRVTFRSSNQNSDKKKIGLDEKYFKPTTDNEESPLRLVLGSLDIQNTPSRRITRSKAHLMSTFT